MVDKVHQQVAVQRQMQLSVLVLMLAGMLHSHVLSNSERLI
jgi:hypothetical protein